MPSSFSMLRGTIFVSASCHQIAASCIGNSSSFFLEIEDMDLLSDTTVRVFSLSADMKMNHTFKSAPLYSSLGPANISHLE